MIKNIIAAGAILGASVSLAQAGDIPATPINHGPLVVSGLGPVGDIANIGLTPVNVVTQPILAPGAGVAVAEPVGAAPVRRHRRHRHKHL